MRAEQLVRRAPGVVGGAGNKCQQRQANECQEDREQGRAEANLHRRITGSRRDGLVRRSSRGCEARSTERVLAAPLLA